MNYIGSKKSLLPFLKHSFNQVISDWSEITFADIFAGSGIVSKSFKHKCKKLIVNDLEYYSYVILRHYIGNNRNLYLESLIHDLNEVETVEGFIYHQYSEGGEADRKYFSSENGRKIDAIRIAIDQWLKNGTINEDQFFCLLCSLLEAADKVANTASVYGAFLKKVKKTAQKRLILSTPAFLESEGRHDVYQMDANQLIRKIEGDILYLDPPYNARQYGANYHLLNTIARHKKFEPKGKTGLPDYNRSLYCKRNEVAQTFEHLLAQAQFKHIFLSYNNEGLMGLSTIQEIMSRFGKYHRFEKKYSRFKADNKRMQKANSTIEYLHLLEKSG